MKDPAIRSRGRPSKVTGTALKVEVASHGYSLVFPIPPYLVTSRDIKAYRSRFVWGKLSNSVIMAFGKGKAYPRRNGGSVCVTIPKGLAHDAKINMGTCLQIETKQAKPDTGFDFLLRLTHTTPNLTKVERKRRAEHRKKLEEAAETKKWDKLELKQARATNDRLRAERDYKDARIRRLKLIIKHHGIGDPPDSHWWLERFKEVDLHDSFGSNEALTIIFGEDWPNNPYFIAFGIEHTRAPITPDIEAHVKVLTNMYQLDDSDTSTQMSCAYRPILGMVMYNFSLEDAFIDIRKDKGCPYPGLSRFEKWTPRGIT